MAFNFGAWLQQMMNEPGPHGAPRYSPETLQDLVALVLLSGKEPLGEVPDEASKILGAFLLRTGLKDVKKGPELKKALDTYFSSHPLPPELVQSLQAEFQREPSGKQTRSMRPIRG